MQIEKITSEKLNQMYYKIKHPTGLNIMLCPMQGYSTSYALFATNYGSIDVSFKTEETSEYLNVTEGIAHFLEHKMFEDEDGDAFARFSQTGASANAYTTFDKTAYLFSCSDNIYQSLKILLDFVQRPYFTKESVEKEQGIIAQEIKMYEDNANWIVFYNLLKNLYVNNPVRIDAAGTVESISVITPELLYQCYNTFYNLNNMTLSIAGDFDKDEILKICENSLKNNKDIKIFRKPIEEPEKINQKKSIAKLSVAMPLFAIGYKLTPAKNRIREYILANFVAQCVIGDCTSFYQKAYSEGIINSTFDSDILCGPSYFSLIIEGESKDPEMVFELIKKEFDKAIETGIHEELFKNIKKSFYGKNIKSFNSVEAIASAMLDASFYDYSIFDMLKEIEDINKDDVYEYLKNEFKSEKSSIS
ncbi:MAG: pitrilysin family protein, partial [Oscillospiraceae bacterium]